MQLCMYSYVYVITNFVPKENNYMVFWRCSEMMQVCSHGVKQRVEGLSISGLYIVCEDFANWVSVR